MFWLAVIGGTLILLHALLVMILKFRKQNKEKQSYGALIFLRFEIFLLILVLPCFCEASAALIKGTSNLSFFTVFCSGHISLDKDSVFILSNLKNQL